MRSLSILALLAALVIASLTVIAPPASAQSGGSITYIDQAAIDAREGRPGILPPPSEWTGNVRACEPEFNPPEWMTRFGGFCQQTAVKAKMSLIYTGEDLIFKFKHP